VARGGGAAPPAFVLFLWLWKSQKNYLVPSTYKTEGLQSISAYKYQNKIQ
jgi:hypothetical protein